MNPILVKPDNRYKDGNIKKVKGILRGNSKTVSMERMNIPTGATLEMQMNPPIVVSPGLATAIKENI